MTTDPREPMTPEMAAHLCELARIVADEVAGPPATADEKVAALETIREIVHPSPAVDLECGECDRLTAENAELRQRVAGVEAVDKDLCRVNLGYVEELNELRAALQRMVDQCRQRSTHSALEPCDHCGPARRLLRGGQDDG